MKMDVLFLAFIVSQIGMAVLAIWLIKKSVEENDSDKRKVN